MLLRVGIGERKRRQKARKARWLGRSGNDIKFYKTIDRYAVRNNAF
jgi:hypothetical protein